MDRERIVREDGERWGGRWGEVWRERMVRGRQSGGCVVGCRADVTNRPQCTYCIASYVPWSKQLPRLDWRRLEAGNVVGALWCDNGEGKSMDDD